MGEFVNVGKTEDVPQGTVRVFETDGRRLAVCNVGGAFYAIDDVCTHDDGPLGEGYLEGQLIECPRHGARFDVTTGRPVALPAVVPVKTYAVEVEGDEIRVQVE